MLKETKREAIIMLDIYQLEQLLAVAQHGTLSGAAEAIHLSQPSMSRSMKKLEEDLQVPLFDRSKNKITLNENGKLAVKWAEQVLDQLQQMETQVRAFDRSQRTISIGSCAPFPLLDVVQRLTSLYFSLPPAHPLSAAKGLHFRDLDGESILLFTQIGFWLEISRRNMPSTHFLMQQDQRDFEALIHSSALPYFVSDRTLKRDGRPENRAIIPILDKDATASFYCVCLQSQTDRFRGFFHGLAANG